ncbi:MAG: peptide MFS transporter [Streptococcaceae bacterium]|jgi:dipeptide/tripeptide permease|nr:peptide MFS transporter [Streptococcaceae bacterium]
MTETKKKRLPLGFYFASSTFALERGAYYSAKFLIIAYLTTAIVNGGLGLSTGEAAMLQANFVAFSFLAPVICGYISDRWIGARYLIPVGMVIMGVGYYFGSIATNTFMINVMIWLVALGTGFFKGNISGVNGQQFDDPDELDGAFSVQYTFVNIGSFVGTTATGILYMYTFAQNGVLGFSQCFLISAIACVFGAVWFAIGTRFMGDAGKRPFKEGVQVEKVETKEEAKPLTGLEKKRVAAIILVSMFSVIFWVFWYLTYVAVWDSVDYVNWTISNFTVPVAWFDSLNAFVCIALGPVFAALWVKLAKRPQGDLSLFKKLALGLSFLGFSFLMLEGVNLTKGDGKASLIWILMFGIFLSVGEMLFSPLGNSFITKYAPTKLLGTLLGVWSVATFIASISYGYLYDFMSQFNPLVVYSAIPAILFVAAIILFVGDKGLSSLVESGEEVEETNESVQAV